MAISKLTSFWVFSSKVKFSILISELTFLFRIIVPVSISTKIPFSFDSFISIFSFVFISSVSPEKIPKSTFTHSIFASVTTWSSKISILSSAHCAPVPIFVSVPVWVSSPVRVFCSVPVFVSHERVCSDNWSVVPVLVSVPVWVSSPVRVSCSVPVFVSHERASPWIHIISHSCGEVRFSFWISSITTSQEMVSIKSSIAYGWNVLVMMSITISTREV